MSFCTRLKEARKNVGMTQSELAEALGIAKSTLSGYENGSSEPSIAMSAKLIEALGVDANFLYQDYQKTDVQLSALESGMITMYRSLDEHGRKIVDMVLREEYSRIVEISSEI